ncbi:MAG: sigma-70 family RNA polymerase sigma factor [Ruminococcaceae bacterium]|nr:sigma-70 family RNA polymerase sigma factor [Oscillospiraceae bacterium]
MSTAKRKKTGNFGKGKAYILSSVIFTFGRRTMFALILSLLTRITHLILGISTPQKYPPPLSHEEEHNLFLQARAGSEDARQKLILHNLRLVSHIVRKYYSTAKNAEDLVSIGSLGLVKAVDSFRVENGAKFTTYAAKCIQNEILMYFRAQKKTTTEVSLNETIDVDRDGNPLTYIDVISCDDDIAEIVDRKMKTAKMLSYIETLLTERERQIIILRYGLGNTAPHAQREVAAILGISRSYVSRIEKCALEKLKNALE